MKADILQADLDRPDHQAAVVALIGAYAEDAMGNGGPLPEAVMKELIPGLRKHPTTLILLAYVEGRPVGIATCFVGFSTFYARPLVNVHDLAILPEYRGQGIGRQLLEGVLDKAKQRGCCKVTLEVHETQPTREADVRGCRVRRGRCPRARRSLAFLLPATLT